MPIAPYTTTHLLDGTLRAVCQGRLRGQWLVCMHPSCSLLLLYWTRIANWEFLSAATTPSYRDQAEGSLLGGKNPHRITPGVTNNQNHSSTCRDGTWAKHWACMQYRAPPAHTPCPSLHSMAMRMLPFLSPCHFGPLTNCPWCAFQPERKNRVRHRLVANPTAPKSEPPLSTLLHAWHPSLPVPPSTHRCTAYLLCWVVLLDSATPALFTGAAILLYDTLCWHSWWIGLVWLFDKNYFPHLTGTRAAHSLLWNISVACIEHSPICRRKPCVQSIQGGCQSSVLCFLDDLPADQGQQ